MTDFSVKIVHFHVCNILGKKALIVITRKFFTKSQILCQEKIFEIPQSIFCHYKILKSQKNLEYMTENDTKCFEMFDFLQICVFIF